MYDNYKYVKKWRHTNSDKHKKYHAEYYQKIKEKRRDYFKNNTLMRKFGISLDEYNRMCVHQNNKCLICGCEEQALSKDKRRKSLAVDHCHITGKIRGLLCSRCNIALGLLDEDITIFEKAIKYLKSS